MSDITMERWGALFVRDRLLPLAVLLGGVLLYATNALLAATVMPSAVGEIGGVAVMSWPTVAFLAASMFASTATGWIAARLGARRAFALGLVVFAGGALVAGLAPTMAVLIAGRFVQGLGGGLISALAYVLTGQVFPAALWPRVFALMSSIWGVAVLTGPLIGGLFAGIGLWRGAFLAVAALALLLLPVSLSVLPAPAPARGRRAEAPLGRMTLVVLGIAAVTVASVAAGAAWKAGLILAALFAFAGFLRLDRQAASPLLPGDAFRLGAPLGLGLWLILLLAIANDPFTIFGPLLLQQLHGLDPLAAGYVVAAESMAWTLVAMLVASLPARLAPFWLVAGPAVMAAGLLGIAFVLPAGPVTALLLPVLLSGGGIGACWSFISQQVMAGARAGEGDAAAAAISAVQMTGLGLGGAIAGLAANLAGFASGLDAEAARAAAFWVPAAAALPALAGAGIGLLALRRA